MMSHLEKYKKNIVTEIQSAKQKINRATTIIELFATKARYFGKTNSVFQEILRKGKSLISTNKITQKEFGENNNLFRTELMTALETRQKRIILLQQQKAEISEGINLSVNNYLVESRTTEHIFSLERRRIINFFSNYNFKISEGNEVETEEDNFRLLNISKHHVSNEQSDTFFIKNRAKYLLRTHCTCSTAVQLSKIQHEGKKSFFNFVTLGKAFRKDTPDATHLHEFYQLDGCMIGSEWNIVTLVKFLNQFLQFFFDHTVETRWRVSYFPFTRPSIEMDIRCPKCEKLGCEFCKKTSWIEILGAGIVHPNVIKLTKIKLSSKEQVVAFGMGIERIIMLKYKIYDIRFLYNHDLRWLVNVKRP